MTQIRNLERIEDFERIPEIQKDAWGFSDRDVEPFQLMTWVQRYGGLVQGLFLAESMIGFTYALIGKWQGEYFIYSHMAAVIREQQGKGYGFLLKQAQREEVLRLGYDAIRWSFDPLEALNAFFNIHRLGALSREYAMNQYGQGSSGLHAGLPTDRLVALWLLSSARVEQRLAKKEPPRTAILPLSALLDFARPEVYIEIPGNIRALKKSDSKAALAWRLQVRGQFQEAFARGFQVEELVYSEDWQRLFYLLRRWA